jgi:serine/threonine-protein kinase
MELLRGRDLTAFTAPDRLLAPDKAVEIAARVAEALGYAHREGAVHFDVRPGNIIYDAASDSVKLTDFGLARITARLKARSGVSLGVAAYMSPEQLAGGEVDGRSDLYSLAVTLHQLLSGSLPGEGALPADRVPAGVAAAIARALSHNAAERFATAEEFSGALVAAMAQAGARASVGEKAAVDISL